MKRGCPASGSAVEDLAEERLAVAEVTSVGGGADPHVERAVDVPLALARARIGEDVGLAAVDLGQAAEERQVGGDAAEVEREGAPGLALLGPGAVRRASRGRRAAPRSPAPARSRAAPALPRRAARSRAARASPAPAGRRRDGRRPAIRPRHALPPAVPPARRSAPPSPPPKAASRRRPRPRRIRPAARPARGRHAAARHRRPPRLGPAQHRRRRVEARPAVRPAGRDEAVEGDPQRPEARLAQPRDEVGDAAVLVERGVENPDSVETAQRHAERDPVLGEEHRPPHRGAVGGAQPASFAGPPRCRRKKPNGWYLNFISGRSISR